MFFERHLENIIELFIPDVTDSKTVLDMVPLCMNYVKRLDISQLLPPVKELQQEEEVYDSMDHFDFSILLDKLSSLEELHVVYRVKRCGMNFEWTMFEMTHRDCETLAKAIKSCKSLKVNTEYHIAASLQRIEHLEHVYCISAFWTSMQVTQHYLETCPQCHEMVVGTT